MDRYPTPPLFDTPAMINLIEAYIEIHPGCASGDIAQAFNLKITQVSIHTTRLRRRGVIRKSRKPDTGQRSYWEPGVDPVVDERNEAFGQPSQETVSTWTPHHERDILVAALFGESK